MKLYWVTTSDHDEDWFVIAKNKQTAKSFFASYEGYDYDKVSAEGVQTVGDEYFAIKAYHPSVVQLKQLGFKIYERGQSIFAWKNGKIYEEGNIVKNLAFKIYDKVPVVYIIKLYGGNHYKIGVTKDLSRRIKTFNTSNPQGFDIFNIVHCDKPYQLERKLHATFKNKRFAREWFLLTNKDLRNLSRIISEYSKLEELFKLV